MSPFELPAARTRPAAGAAPDADRLLRPVVEVVGLGLVRDRAAALVARVLERRCAPDHPLARNPVDVLADRPHEVAAATGCDVVRKAVGLEVGEQLDHREVRAFEIPATERRMLGRAQERIGLRLEVVDADPLVGREDTAQKRAHIGVVAGVVVVEHLPQPGIVALVRRLPRLAVAQLRVGLGHLVQPAENEVGLDRHRLLAPQGAVVVEHRDAFLGGHGVRDGPRDELHHGALRGTIVPACQHVAVTGESSRRPSAPGPRTRPACGEGPHRCRGDREPVSADRAAMA